MQKKKRILITGAGGTIGMALLKEIFQSKRDYEINVFDIKTKALQRRFSTYKDKIHTFWGDISQPGDLDEACRERDVVIHLAALIPPKADEFPALAQRVNEEGTRNLIRTLERLSPGAFLLYASSIAVYGDRLNDPDIRVTDPLKCSKGDMYARTKINAEKLIQNSSLNWSIFRLTAIMGVNNHKISKLMFHMPLNTPMEIATPEDTARAYANAIEHTAQLSHRIFNLSGGSVCRIQYNDFLARSFKIFGLGKLNFPRNAFAGKNFHCAYYADGDELEDILHFRRDSIESYFSRVKRSISSAQRNITGMFRMLIKKQLLKQSEPLQAVRRHDVPLIQRFFGKEIRSAK
ncbi:MAG: NAD(P)-dependent oxidoreductase [Candidatus Neomarinimicrobiota bacterium]|nr:NAD(P)-dependent oxidoreductase [Candidatus Neomarinimicrobiota bacterium]MDD3965832.1 NAD(P)-dependent oxidoreductase [Candidatus Neomarinimicrobiota bacterium]MDX9779705.1 NAD(P)-dependent oxidoreductase [bacterium]